MMTLFPRLLAQALGGLAPELELPVCDAKDNYAPAEGKRAMTESPEDIRWPVVEAEHLLKRALVRLGQANREVAEAERQVKCANQTMVARLVANGYTGLLERPVGLTQLVDREIKRELKDKCS